MESTVSKSKRSKSILSFLLMFFVSLCTLVTFTACKLTNSDPDQGANFDASGNLKLVSPYVEFNKSSDGNVIDENSGSFTWKLQYYYSGSNEDYLKNINFDQDYLFANFFSDADFENVYTGNIPTKRATPGSNYFVNGKDGETGDKLYSPVFYIDKDNISFPSYEVVVDGNYYTFKVCVNKDYLERMTNQEISDNIIYDGTTTRLKNIFKDLSWVDTNGDGKADSWKDDADYGSLFTFEYRTGKNTDGAFVQCPKGMMSYFINSYGEFCIRFNPQLQAGSVNRYLKVKALADCEGRANSNYSSTVAFEAYAVSFEVYSPNSSTLDYGGLSYDPEQYYFAYEKTYYDSPTDSNPIKALTGYFPEGRKIVVSRTSDYSDSYNYAFQNWTMNTKAEYSLADKEKYPDKINTKTVHTGSDILSDKTKSLSDAFQVVASYRDVQNLKYYEKADIGVTQIQKKEGNEKLLLYTYSPEHTRTGADADTKIHDEIVVTSHSTINGYKFYANYAKVRGFLASGSFFAGDNFFTTGDQNLSEVSIFLFYKTYESNGTSKYVSRQLTVGSDGTGSISHGDGGLFSSLNDYNDACYPNGVKYTIDGSYFKVEGLENTDFIIFQKEGSSLLTSENKPYSFYSQYLKEIEAMGSTFKGLDLVVSDNLISDRQDVGIIGTQYAENSNVVVNLYRLLDSKGTTEGLSSTYLDLLKNTDVSYEIIKSVSSVEDENGFITTNIILSLILPSNATLTGYNVETVQTNSKIFFSTSENGEIKYVSFVKYDETSMDEYVVDIEGKKSNDEKTLPVYEFVKTSISNSEDVNKYSSQMVYYKETLYTLDHEEVGGYLASSNTSRIYLYKADAGKYLVKESKNGGEEWYELKYTKRALTPEYSLENGETTYKINGETVYEQRNSSNVSTIATAYETEMEFENPNYKSGDPEEQKEQTIYVYYDVKQVGKNFFYISPIGKQTLITSKNATSSSTTTSVEDDLYFSQISNFKALKTSKKIMLGSEILSSNIDFKEAIGSKLIMNCYYYVEALGSQTELFFSQYINNNKTKENLTVITYYDENGNQYKGETCQGYSYENGEIKNNFQTTLILRNPQGIEIDSNIYQYYAGFETTSGTALENAHNYLKNDDDGKNYNKTDLSTKFEFILNGATYRSKTIIDGYGKNLEYENASNTDDKGTYALAQETTTGIGSTNKIKRVITMYEYNESAGRFISYSLFFDGSSYHKIVGSTYVSYKDGSDNIQSDKFFVYDISILSFSFVSTDFNIFGEENKNKEINYLNLITDTSSKITAKQRVYGESEEKTITSYTRFIVNSFVEYDGTGKVVNTYSPVVKDGSGNKQLINQTTANTVTLENFLGVNKDASGNITSFTKLYFKKENKEFVNYKDTLVRRAQTKENNDVTVLGKYITTNDSSSPKVYPSFSSFLTFTEEETHVLDRNSDGEINYYSMDYTTKKSVVEGFPGFSLLAGIPYPNPVLTFQVRHKSYENPTINIALDISNGYYVEVMGTNIATDETNLVRDFTTYSFKDTVENLLQNDYIDNAYWVLERSTFNTVSALIETNDPNNYDVMKTVDGRKHYYNYYMFTTEIDENNNVIKKSSPLTIQNVGLNENDKQLYAEGYVGVDNTYYKKLYIMSSSGSIKELTTDDVILWKTSASVLSGVPTFDIHTYSQGLDGIIYFNSGSYNDENIICNGLSGITAGSTQSVSGYYDYSEVLIGGVTYAYRTLSSQVNNSDNMSGYQFDKMINVLNAYNSTDAYFLTGKESAVLVASPIVKIADGAGNSFVYRFREWKVYSRYNSEVLYYNRGVTENLADRYNAILRFSSGNAGYFVMFPVYERVFDIDLGSAIVDGAINQGGSINVSYKDGEESDVDNLYDDNLYFINYEKISYGDKEGYYYGNLKGYPFLYFTGEYIGDDTSKPIFERLDNVYVVELTTTLSSVYVTEKNVNVPLFFQIDESTKQVRFLNIISKFEAGAPGIVLLENYNGQYTYFGFDSIIYKFEDDDGFYLKGESDPVKFYEILNTSFTADFFFDEITESSISTSVPLHYDTKTQTFNVLDVKGNSFFGSEFVLSLMFYNVYENEILFSSINAILAFCEEINNMKNTGYNENSPWILAINNINNEDKIKTDGGLIINSLNGMGKISTYLGDKIASYDQKIFTVIKKITNPYVNGLYVSRFGSLTAGELATDEEGNIYSSQQFKTAYLDRDSYVELQAIADSGYRFEGWYKCEYDEENGFWFTTDEKVQNSKNIYSDEIIQAYYNKYTGKYYYITDYCEDFDYTDSNGESIVAHIYYLDSDHTELAVVPDRMLDKVRGYFINHGTKNNPNYIQVFKRYGGLLDESYYYDSSFINPVDTTAYEVEERTFIDSIRVLDYGSEGIFYYLSNVGIYFNEDDGKYYRDMTTGNIVVSGDKITIKNLHSNVRFVAKFIETYNEYIFTEDEESTGISIQAVYYSNNNQKYDSDGNVVIRTDIDGNNRTNTAEYSDSVANSLDKNLFRLYEDETKNDVLSAYGSDKNYMSSTYNYSNGTYTETNDYSVYKNLLNGFSNVTGSNADTYSVNINDPTLNKKFNLQSMYFDVNTTVTIVVRVKAEFELSVHSLGVNSKYNIYPIFYPKSDYVEANQKASADTKVDYLYYILQLTYNRDPQNQYRGYIVHPNRGENMAYDALVGNYIDVYGSYFNYYDNNNKLIEYLISKSMGKTTDKTEIKLKPSYVSSVSGSKVSLNSSYSNFEEALKELSKLMGNPELLKVDHIKLKVDVKDKNGNVAYSKGSIIKDKNTLISVLREIFNSVRPTDNTNKVKINKTYIDKNGDNKNETIEANNAINLIQNGQRNFINLSTIPVYNYTVQAIVIDSDKDNGEIKKDQNGKVILPSANYEKDDITYPTLYDSLYVTGGTGGKNYLGSGSNVGTEYIYKQLSNGTTSTTLKFDHYVDGIDYAKKTIEDNGNESMFEDLVFVQNSIILFEGIQNVPSKDGNSYLFVGWYEQKYNRDTESWSDLVFMSSEEKTPYVSLATADTVIVAIYKRAVNVTFTFDQSEIAFEMSNALVDSAGNPLEIEKDQNIVTMNGMFFFDADIEAILSPAGGYRFNGISYSTGGSNVSVFDKLTFSNYQHEYISDEEKFKECDSSEAILNSILKINFKLNEILPDNTSTVTLNIETKKLTLVYVSVDNFIVNDKTTGNKDKFMGYDFALVQKSSTAETILFATKDGNEVKTNAKDSANNDIFFNIDYTLSVYGYFDSDIADDLVLLTYKKSDSTENTSIKQWFINRDTSSDYYTSNEKYFKDVNLSYEKEFSPKITNTYADYTMVDNFKVVFQYNNSVVDVDGQKLNDSSRLNLSDDNAVYFAQAEITTETTSVLKVSHYLVENISNASKTNSSINGSLGRKLGDGDGKITILTYSGSTASGEGENPVGNSAQLIKMDYSEEFSSGTKVDLDVSSSFFIDNGKLYVFVGWFSENATSGKLTLLSTSKSISNQKANGSYVARFVRVSKIDSSSIENADISFEGTQVVPMGSVNANVQVFGELDKVSWDSSTSKFVVDEDAKRLQYAFVGSSLRFTLTPRPNMVIHSCSVSGNSSGNILFTEEMNASNSSAIDYTVEKLPTNNVVSISASVKKGYTVKIKQTLYDNFNMTGDSESLSGCVSLKIGLENSYDATDSEFSVEPGKSITLTDKSNDYYFIGFFVENKIVSKKDGKYENSHEFTITEDTIIEARFTKYNYVAVTSTLQGTNTTIENFTFTLSYVDPRTNSTIIFTNVNELLKIPAGISATIKTTSDSDAYNFIGFKTIDFDGNIKKSISSSKTAQLALDQTYCSASNETGILKGDKGKETNFIYISAMYQKTTVLKVVKNVEISSVSQTYFSEGTNKNLTEEQMRSLFNLIVSYVDSFGETRTVTLGSVNQISNIRVKKGSTVKITPVIASVVSHRYTVYDFEFKYDNNSHKSDVTQKSDGSFEFVCGEDSKMSSLEFTVYFKPCKTVTISKELAGSSTTNVTVDYSFVNSNNANQTGTLSATNKTEINIKEGGNFTLTANVSDADKFTFIGWFVDGKMISNQKTISSISSSSNYMSELKTASSIVAKFMETINLKVERRLFEFENRNQFGIDVTDEKHDSNFGEFFVVADFVNDDGMSHSVKKMSLSEIRNSTNLKIIAGTKISVVSTQSPNYLFDGYEFSSGGTYSTLTGDSLSDGYSLVADGFSQDLTIKIKFEEFRSVTYLVSTTNSDSKSENGIEITNPETYLSRVVDNDNSFGISFNANVHEGYVIESIEFNGTNVGFTFDAEKKEYSLTVKKDWVEENNNILKINVKETLKINVYVAFDDITDASKVPSGVSVKFNDEIPTTLNSSSGTLLASNSSIKALENVKITILGTVAGFRFDGFYLYEGDSAVSSVSPITFENTFEFLANSSLSVVAKFTSNKTPSSINTRILNDNGTSNFAGWFARVNSTTSLTGYRDILLSTNYSDKNSFNGKFDIVVAKYQTTSTTDQTVEISGAFAHFGSAIIFVHSSSLSNVSVEGTAKNLTVSNVETGSISVDFIPAKGFIVTNKTDFACEIEKKQINVEVQVDMNKVTKNVVSNSGTTSSVSVKDNKITADVTIKIVGATNSTVLANILNSETNETTSKTLTATENEFKVQVQSGSSINLSFALATFEKFNGFKITENGSSRVVTTNSLDYLVLNSFESVTIEVLFDDAFISTIAENDTTKGTASLHEEKTGETVLFVQVYEGYEISAIFATEISSGSIVEWKNIFESEDDAKELLGNDLTITSSVSEKDSFENDYVTKCEIKFTASKNVAFKIEYKMVSKVNFYVYADGDVEVISKYVNDSPLTLEKIESYDILSKLKNEEIKNAYSFDKFSYLGKEITSETKIDLTDGIINIEVSMNKAYKLQFSIVIDSSGIGFNIPTDGLKVTFEGEKIATYGGISQLINYKLSNLTKVVALDENDFYDFSGFFSKGKLISSASSYVFTASDILENLEQITIGDETVYVVNVMFKERYQTLTIKKDYNFEGKNLTLKFNGTEFSPNEAYQYIEITGCGNIAHRMLSDSEGNSYFEISYPYSIVKKGKASQLTITQNAVENTSDPYLKIVGASAFYELDIDGQYYRFDNFYGENNLPFENATKYSNKLTINLKDLGIDKTVIAKMIKLYQIDYIYDVVDPNVKISIDFLKIDTNGTGVVYETVASSANQANIKDAIISYRAEAGTTIRVNVDFQGASDEIKGKFKSVLVSSSNVLSKLSDASINSYDWTNHIKDNNYIAVSKFLSGTNSFSSLVFNDTSSFNFKPTQNLSFIADFGYGTEDVSRSTFSIVSVFWTLNNNLITYKVGDQSMSTIDGQGFSFTSTNTGGSSMSYVESTMTKSDIKFTDISSIVESIKIQIYKGNYYKYSSTKKDNNQYNYHVILNLYSKIETGVKKIIKSDYGVEISTFSNGSPTPTVNITQHNNKDGTTTANTGNKGRITVEVSVAPIDQYFFKGFAIVSSNYESTYNILQLGGERANATTEQYNFVKHTTNYDANGIATKYSATVTISGNTKIIAIFEPTVYTITVNTYKFFEDNKKTNYSDDREKLVEKSSDIDKNGNISEDKYQTTESATIEGSLIALAGESIKITSVSYQYSQFVGFTGWGYSDDPALANIMFGFDSGEGISQEQNKSLSDTINGIFNNESTEGDNEKIWTDELNVYLDEETKENKKYIYYRNFLSKYNICPGYNTDEFGGLTYVSSSSRNNFYALNVNQSFTINFFYTNLSYKLMLDLSETESTIYYDKDNSSIKSTSYLAYSEDYTSWKDYYDSGKTDPSQYEQKTFKNPSAGTYSITKNYGTNSKNNDDNNYTITIEQNDPFVYVINDSNDKYIGYPTKISVELVEMRDSSDDPVKKKDLFYKGTEVRVKIAQADKENFGYKSGNELYLTGYADDGVGSEVGDLKKYGFDYNVSGKSSDGRPTLRNITNYLTTNGTLKDNLFVIEIDNQTIKSQDIQDSNIFINYEEQTIRVVYKIVASDVGFPTVSVTMFDSTSGKKSTENKADLLASINKVQIKNNTKSENKQTKSESSASNIFSITGFNQALFETDAQTSDPNFKLGNIDVNLNLIWQTTAKEVVAQVELLKVELLKKDKITLTGVKSDSNYDKIAYDSSGCCRDSKTDGQHVREHDEEIRAYFIIIVKNGFTLIDLLQKLLNEGYLDQGTAGTAMTYLLETPYGITNGYGKLTSKETAQIGHGAVGSLTGGGDQRSDIFKQVNTAINKYYKTSNVDYFASTFAYHVIDAYELYKNEINGNFFNNASNTNDLVVAQCVLQEHEEPQENHKDGWLHWLWTADKGYAYYNSATGSFDAKKNNGSCSVTYHNNAEKAEMDTSSTAKVESRSFWDKVVGTFNSSKSFAGTYNRFITIGYAPTDADFIANDNIIAKITIDNNSKYQVVTRVFDYDPMPILNAVTGAITYFAPVFLTLIPGVGPFLGIAYCAIAVGSAIWSICDPDVKFIYDYWANIY